MHELRGKFWEGVTKASEIVHHVENMRVLGADGEAVNGWKLACGHSANGLRLCASSIPKEVTCGGCKEVLGL